MCEIPTNVIRLNDFLDVGMDGVSIGSKDLTMLILGQIGTIAKLHTIFPKWILRSFGHLNMSSKHVQKRGVTSSMCGQAPSDYPDL